MSGVLKEDAKDLLFDVSDPGKIIDRKGQIKTLKEMLFSELKVGKTTLPTVYIYGSSGTGKTVVTKKLQNQNKRDAEDHNIELKSIFFNGRNYQTEYNMLVKIASSLNEYLPVESYQKDSVPTYGLRKDELLELVKNILKEKDLIFLITIDEIDKIEEEAAKNIIASIYDYHNQDGLPIYLITISNDPYFLKNAPSDITQRVGKKIHFPTYGTNELVEILEYFAQYTIESYEKRDLFEIAKRVHNTTGSARDAKRMLYYVAEQSEEELDTSNLEEAEVKVEMDELREEITAKPYQQVAVLLALAKAWKTYEKVKDTRDKKTAKRHLPKTKKIHKRYKEECKEYGLEKRSVRTLRRFIKNLQKDTLVATEVKGFGRGRGVSTVVELVHDHNVIKKISSDVLDSRLEDLEEED